MVKSFLSRHFIFFGALILGAHIKCVNAADGKVPGEVRWLPPVVLATGNASVGPWRMNDSEFHYVTDASADLRGDGSAGVVWVDNERREVLFQRYGADDEPRFDGPVNVSHSPDIFSWLPEVAFTPADDVYVLWQEIVFSGGTHGGEIFFARSDNGGSNFSEPLNLSNTTAGAGKGRLTEEKWDNGSLDLLLGADGELFVAWTEYQGDLHFRRSEDGGRSFEETIKVAGSARQPARAPTLAQTSDGVLYLAWALGEDASADIHIAVSRDGGKSFGPARRVYSSKGHSDIPQLATDSNGVVHLVHEESPGGMFAQSHIRHLQLRENGKAATTPRVVSSGIESSSDLEGGHGAQAPALGTDRNGRIFVVWEHHPSNSQYARGLGFAFSPDGGKTFSEPELIPGSKDPAGGVNGSLQGALGSKLSVNDRGEIAVVNSHFDLNNRSRIVLIRGRAPEG